VNEMHIPKTSQEPVNKVCRTMSPFVTFGMCSQPRSLYQEAIRPNLQKVTCIPHKRRPTPRHKGW